MDIVFNLLPTTDIEIRAVEPVAVDNIFKDMKVPIQISSFYDNQNISKFKFDRPFNKGEKDPNNEFKVKIFEKFRDKLLRFLR